MHSKPRKTIAPKHNFFPSTGMAFVPCTNEKPSIIYKNKIYGFSLVIRVPLLCSASITLSSVDLSLLRPASYSLTRYLSIVVAFASMSDSSTIDVCQDALLSLALPDSLRSGGIPSDFIVVHQPQAQAQADMQEKLQAPTAHFDLENEYDSYINAAFHSSKESQAYLFMGTEYVVFDYSQGLSFAKVVEGPLPICKKFPFLKFTFFVEYELDAALGSGENEAIFFLGDECAKINYSSNPSHDIKQITETFPFLQGTLFESNIDAALESWKSNEAFLFKDDQCVCINYSSDNCSLVGTIRLIVEFFPVLKDTFFDSGIQAAFAKSITNYYCYEVVLFKKDRWAWIKYGSLTRRFDTPLLHIGQLFPSVRNILPQLNIGLDGHGIHCGCVPNPSIGSTRRIYTPEEVEWLEAAEERNCRSGKDVEFEDLLRELEEAIANKSNIGS